MQPSFEISVSFLDQKAYNSRANMHCFYLLLNSTLMVSNTRFSAVRHMNVETGLLSIDNFKAALASIQRQPKLECLNGMGYLNTLFPLSHAFPAFEFLNFPWFIPRLIGWIWSC